MKKYLKIFSLSVAHALRNGKALAGLSVFLVVCLVIFSNLWKVIAARTGVFHLDPAELLWYIALNEWVLIALPRPEREIEIDLRSGKLAYSLPKPMSYLGATFCESLGLYTVNLFVLGGVAFGFTWWQAGSFPAPLFSLPFLILTAFLAGILGILFQMLIGLSAFWIHEVEPFAWLWEKLLFALGGLLLPLSVYPQLWQTVAQYTPFSYILGYRSALVMHYDLNSLLLVIGALTFWSLIGVACLFLLYRKGLKILNMEGG
jgi:ABC-2 type transport system permease protein